MTTDQRVEEQQLALDTARELARTGVPLFIAEPDPAGIGHSNTGYWMPTGWQQTRADPATVDLWRPGKALCGVMGHSLDLLDVDPRNGGELSVLNGSTPTSYGVVLTPSGGVHSFIASLGVGSRDNIVPGIDVKGGAVDGSGHGFAFLPPTIRRSKTTGEPTPYRWARRPDFERLEAVLRGEVTDTSGARLAARIRELKASGGVRKIGGGPDWWREFLTEREPQAAVAADKAINDKLGEVTGWTAQSGAGFRSVLLRAAMTLGGYVGSGYLDQDAAQERLEAAVSEVWGNPDSDDLLWISQGLTDGAEQPFYVYTPEDERAWSEAAQAVAAQGEDPRPDTHPSVNDVVVPPPPWNIFSVLGGDPFDPRLDSTDQGLAEAVAARMYPVLRYARDAGSWVKRERDVWEEIKDSDAVPNWIVAQMAKLMPIGQTPVPKEVTERTEGHWQAVRRAMFMSSAGTGKVARKLRALVHSDHPATLRVAELDTNPEVLWAGGVPWDLRASGDRPTAAEWVDPNTPHLHTALCAPNPAVPTPRWDAFLAAVLPDPELRTWALRVLSIALTGYADAALPVLYGRERSGKTSLIEMVVTVLGSYAHAANPKLLSAQDASHDAIIYDLKGRRLSFIDEGPKRGYESTERLKQLTGGGSLTAAKKYGNPITFRPTHTLVMTTNNEPTLTDPALRARMRLIPCDELEATVRPVRLPLLGYGLVTEAPGILAQLMAHTAGYLADRDSAAVSAAPVTVRGLATEMSENQDPIREWVETATVPTTPGTAARELYNQFAEWHQSRALYRRASVPTETAFGRTLNEMGYPKSEKKINNHWYRPLSVLHGPGTPAPPPTPAAFMGISGGSSGSVPGSTESDPVPGSSDRRRSGPVFPPPSSYFPSYIHEKRGGEVEESRGEVGEREHENRTSSRKADEDRLRPSEMPLTCDDEAFRVDFSDPDEAPGATPNELKGAVKQGELPFETPLTSENTVQGPKKITNTDVAARAYQGEPKKVITKAEARALLKAEERAAAIAAAAGEVLELPVVVDRAQRTLPVTPQQAGDLVRAAVVQSGALTVDVETSGYPVGHEHYQLRSVQLGDAAWAVVLDPVTHAELIRELLAEAPKLHAHSASADLVPLAHAGLVDAGAGWAKMHDTVIPAKLADPQSTGSDPGLKQLSEAVLGATSVAPAADAGRDALWKAARWQTGKQRFVNQLTTPLERNGWAQVQTGCTTMLRYAASDVLDTAALAQVLPPVPDAVLARERLAEEMTARVAHRGLRIDAERVAELSAEHIRLQAEAGARVRAYGPENPGSGPQIAEALTKLGEALPVSEKGNPSVAEHVLSVIKRSRPDTDAGRLATAVLDYRHSTTVLGLFLAPYAALCERSDARMRPTVYTLGTDTGRMSAVRPNIQQLPREGGIRSVVTADPGHVLISADFSGVELRGAAALSQDPTMMHMIAEEDAGRFDGFHWAVARQAFGPDATKSDRYVAKRGVFGKIYGGGVATLAKQVGVTEHEMGAIVASLDALTPGLSQWSETIRRAVRQGHTQFPSYSGRVIHFPRDYPHKAPNYAIQGSCRELLVDALVRWRDTRWGDCTLVPVHDELIVMVPEGDAQEATRELVRCMAGDLYGVQIVADPSEPTFAWSDSA
jgi:P4 family phage/plasmid primase-like protien